MCQIYINCIRDIQRYISVCSCHSDAEWQEHICINCIREIQRDIQVLHLQQLHQRYIFTSASEMHMCHIYSNCIRDIHIQLHQKCTCVIYIATASEIYIRDEHVSHVYPLHQRYTCTTASEMHLCHIYSNCIRDMYIYNCIRNVHVSRIQVHQKCTCVTYIATASETYIRDIHVSHIQQLHQRYTEIRMYISDAVALFSTRYKTQMIYKRHTQREIYTEIQEKRVWRDA